MKTVTFSLAHKGRRMANGGFQRQQHIAVINTLLPTHDAPMNSAGGFILLD